MSSNTSTLEKDSAFKIANLIMFTKITQALSILSFLLSASMAGGGYFAYKYFSSPQFKTKVMNEVMQEVQKILPGQIDKKLPSVTGKSLPI